MYFIGFDHLEHIYEIKIAGKIGSIKAKLGDKMCGELVNSTLSSVSHEYSIANIASSWKRELVNGDVVYPVTDEGMGFGYYSDVSRIDRDDTADRENGGISGIAKGDKDVWMIDKTVYPIPFGNWRPAIRMSTLAKAILEDAGFTVGQSYKSHYDYAEIDDAYMLLKFAETDDEASFVRRTVGGFETPTSRISVANNATVLMQPLADIGVPSYVLENLSIGTASAFIQFPAFDTKNKVRSYLRIYSPTSSGIPTGTVTLKVSYADDRVINMNDLTWSNTGTGYYFALVEAIDNIEVPSGMGVDWYVYNQTGVGIEVYMSMFIDGNDVGIPLDRSIEKALGNISQVDFLSSFLKHFGLYLQYYKDSNILDIASYGQIIDDGSTKDWTEKIEYITKYRNDSLASVIPRVYDYPYVDYDSYINELSKDAYGGSMGSLRVNVELQTMLDKIETKTVFSPSTIASSEIEEWIIMRNFKDVKTPKKTDKTGYNIFYYTGYTNLSGAWVDGNGISRHKTFYTEKGDGSVSFQAVWPNISTISNSGREILYKHDENLERNRPTVIMDTFKSYHSKRFLEWFGLDYEVGSDPILTASNLKKARLFVASAWLSVDDYDNLSFGDEITITNNYGTASFRVLSIKGFDVLGRKPAQLLLVRIVESIKSFPQFRSSEGNIYLRYSNAGGYFFIDGRTSNVGSGQIIISDWSTAINVPPPPKTLQTLLGEFTILAGETSLRYTSGGAGVDYFNERLIEI
jgi:hypothetical protein